MTRPWYLLPIIVGAQFAGTSLWFAGNAVLTHSASGTALSTVLLTAAVQAGFIVGTFLFSLLALADRMAPSLLFFLCSVLAALFNTALALWSHEETMVFVFRLATGFFLAGIYPVGMKIAADWYGGSLGKALGYLVGALVLGTAFPHLLKGSLSAAAAPDLLMLLSALACSGGLALWLLVPAGPYRKKSAAFEAAAALHIFRKKDFRSAAFGYFGHMWELYTFWAFVPALLRLHQTVQPNTNLNSSFWSFLIIGIGSLGCVAGGSLSSNWGSARIAAGTLAVSGLCCLLCPFLIALPTPLFLLYLLVWGLSVVADSPQLSALAAQTAPPELKGTALTATTCLGFGLTIISMQVVHWLFQQNIPQELAFALLGAGPILGLAGMSRLLRKDTPK